MLAKELDELRDNMMANAASLARLRLLNGEQLKSLKMIPGYRALASDVLTLCSMFRDDWSALQGKTPFTLEQLHRAGTLALELVSAVGLREQAPVATGDATVLRQKAFTLLLRAHEQARRAVQYLRNDIGAADSIAPSLYLNRTRRRTEGAEVEAPSEESVATPSITPKPPDVTLPPAAPIVINNPARFPVTGSPFSN